METKISKEKTRSGNGTGWGSGRSLDRLAGAGRVDSGGRAESGRGRLERRSGRGRGRGGCQGRWGSPDPSRRGSAGTWYNANAYFHTWRTFNNTWVKDSSACGKYASRLWRPTEIPWPTVCLRCSPGSSPLLLIVADLGHELWAKLSGAAPTLDVRTREPHQQAAALVVCACAPRRGRALGKGVCLPPARGGRSRGGRAAPRP